MLEGPNRCRSVSGLRLSRRRHVWCRRRGRKRRRAGVNAGLALRAFSSQTIASSRCHCTNAPVQSGNSKQRFGIERTEADGLLLEWRCLQPGQSVLISGAVAAETAAPLLSARPTAGLHRHRPRGHCLTISRPNAAPRRRAAAAGPAPAAPHRDGPCRRGRRRPRAAPLVGTGRRD